MYCEAIEHAGTWLTNKKYFNITFDKKIINDFITKHLPKCYCKPPASKDIKTIRAAAYQLLKIIQQDNDSFPVSTETNNICNILNAFDKYLKDICGFSENTRIYRKRYILSFLKKEHITDLSQIEFIKPQAIMRFIKGFSSYSSGSLSVVSSSLRSFFKYGVFCGYNVKSLIAGVPSIANWRLAGIPKFINNTEIKKFINTFDKKTPSGKRDYAMARCFVDLGLRCNEVANLKIKDINWHEAIIKISRGKTKREDQLPLTNSVGEAIADYLTHGRPKSKSEFIFLFHRAPLGENIKTTTVRAVIRRAFQKAGFNPVPSPHILRHSFATQLLNTGSSLKDIADLLRHKNIDTTMIYTKVDLPHLRSVAMPWIGEYHEKI
jgi:site-specific recombinase XerD